MLATDGSPPPSPRRPQMRRAWLQPTSIVTASPTSRSSTPPPARRPATALLPTPTDRAAPTSTLRHAILSACMAPRSRPATLITTATSTSSSPTPPPAITPISPFSWATPSGSFQPATNYTLGSLSQDAFLADVNKDGKLDLIEDGGVALGKGDGTFGPLTAFPAGLGFGTTNPFTVADFNGDGNPDVAFADSRSVGQLWHNPDPAG